MYYYVSFAICEAFCCVAGNVKSARREKIAGLLSMFDSLSLLRSHFTNFLVGKVRSHT